MTLTFNSSLLKGESVTFDAQSTVAKENNAHGKYWVSMQNVLFCGMSLVNMIRAWTITVAG